MKTIASLKGPDFLRACNKLRHTASDFLEKTHVLDLRKIVPVIPDGTDEAEKYKIYAKQAKKNISAMLDRLLDEYPEETYQLLLAMMIPEHKTESRLDEETGMEITVEMEEYEDPDGFDLISAGLELLSAPKVVDFFTKLTKSVLENMDD